MGDSLTIARASTILGIYEFLSCKTEMQLFLYTFNKNKI